MTDSKSAGSGGENDNVAGGAEQNEIIVDPENFDETVRMECPECGLSGDVPAEWEGLQIECKECDERFTVRSTEPGAEQ